MNTVIKVENLSKRYIIDHQKNEKYYTLRDLISNNISNFRKKIISPFTKNLSFNNKTHEEFWAVKDVSFDVKKGERIGIIGRNGAGKSTLLKLLSRITEPTKGRIYLEGRVASLLEVGTGFHPELTARENIYLNGVILGMAISDIKKHFDAIVDFAGIEKFIDTPVKRFSSGMYVRLAFSIAAHLEPEILIIDEVLAVGDLEFQKKCLGKMEDVSKNEGRTILFVSHNMAAIQNICTKVIWLNYGEIIDNGNTHNVISNYLQNFSEFVNISLTDRKDREGNGVIRFTEVNFKDESGNYIQTFQCGKKSIFEIKFDNLQNQPLKDFEIAIGIDDQNGLRILFLNNGLTNQVFSYVPININTLEITIDKLALAAGKYTFTIFSRVSGIISDWVKEAGVFHVESGDFFLTGKLPPEGQGIFYINQSFKLVE